MSSLGMSRSMTLRCINGDSWDDVKPHLWNFFRAVKIAQAGGGGCGVWESCGDCVPHGERVVFPEEAGVLGCGGEGGKGVRLCPH